MQSAWHLLMYARKVLVTMSVGLIDRASTCVIGVLRASSDKSSITSAMHHHDISKVVLTVTSSLTRE